jgi:hypothetical protein
MRVIRVFHVRESRKLNFHVKKSTPGLDSEGVHRAYAACGVRAVLVRRRVRCRMQCPVRASRRAVRRVV